MNQIGGQTQDLGNFFRQMEDNLNFSGNWKMTSIFQANGRRPQSVVQMEDILNLLGKWKISI
jgi:hypothetical protein